MAIRKPSYSSSVFINCPFDEEYKPILHAIIFCIYDCGFAVRIALETVGGDNRLDRLISCIKESRFSIHDLSRIESPRLNMAFECGLFVGAQRFGNQKQKSKDLLILDAVDHRYKQTMSDVAGQDGKIHHNKPNEAIAGVRAFLYRKSKRASIPGAAKINERYNQFLRELPKMAEVARVTPDELTSFDYLLDLIEVMRTWILRTS